MSARPDALLVADAHGFILDRIAQSFVQYGRAKHEVVHSRHVNPFALRMRARRAGLVHWVESLSFRLAPNAVNVPQVAMLHHANPEEVESVVIASVHADALTTTSVRWQRKLEQLTRRNVTLIPYTVDTTVFVPAPDRAAWRQQLGIGADEFVIGYSGRAGSDAHGRKGIDLLEAVLRESAKRWRVTVLLIGEGWNALAASLESAGARVVRQQPQTTEETARYYPAMDVLLSTSREEGGPCTILEAMSCRVPVITTDVGHVPETVTHRKDGFIAAPDAAEFLACIEAIRTNRELVASLVEHGRRRMETERDPRVVIPRVDFDSLYAEARRVFAQRTAPEKVTRAIHNTGLGLGVVSRAAKRVVGWRR